MESKQPSKPVMLSLLLLVVNSGVLYYLKGSEIPLNPYPEWDKLHISTVAF